MAAWYNEHDPFAAAWLRQLIAQGLIADGEVDERDIQDIRPDEIDHYTQCHFFAGIGVWSYALRRAGWPDDRPVWTGSCPCQPFSTSGQRAGFADERHLWPAWYHLISECRPDALYSEQVASADGLAWLDLVLDDLAAAHYTAGAVDLCAAGVGAPHIRQRLWIVAYREDAGRRRQSGGGDLSPAATAGPQFAGRDGHREFQGLSIPDKTNGFWLNPDWIAGHDGILRPIEPGAEPLAYGAPGRLGRCRGYGNALCAEAAKHFIQASM